MVRVNGLFHVNLPGIGSPPGLAMVPDQRRTPVDLFQAVHTQAICIVVANVVQGLRAQDDVDTITFQDMVVPAFKFAMATGTGFRHRNCFTPNIIT
jgi:hypothetical protein